MATNGTNAKSLRRRLQRQLEFYLSASNLRQDKFLQQHMDDEGFLPAALFLSFNKMKTMRATEKLLLEAAAKSDALRVDEPHAAIAPSKEALKDAMERGQEVADDHTIYVEGYDVDAQDHDSLRKVFAVFGKVNLVSMPRFSPSRKFKGFAFVEFATQEAAAQALQGMGGKDRDAPLVGQRAMSKRQWAEMKEKLKAQLGGSGTKPKTTTSNGGTTASNAGAIVSNGGTAASNEATTAKVQNHLVASSSGKMSNGHVRFRDDDDDDGQDVDDQQRPNDAKRPRTNHP